ncbi:MAG: anti-anti-sigma factor [Pseudonocardiales bacterium]|jgi:anti-sigma B factor antagonist|nr:anti-anti-sigma factor [Pseudonocardiales bacterium]
MTGQAARPEPVNEPVRTDLGSLSVTVWRPAVPHCTVLLAGEIDMITVPDLRACVLAELQARPLTLVLDFRDVTFFGSAGLAFLIEIRDVAMEQDTELYLTSVTRGVARLLDIVGLAGMFRSDTRPGAATP